MASPGQFSPRSPRCLSASSTTNLNQCNLMAPPPPLCWPGQRVPARARSSEISSHPKSPNPDRNCLGGSIGGRDLLLGIHGGIWALPRRPIWLAGRRTGIEIESWAGGGRRPHDLPDFLASRLALPVNQSTLRWERTKLQQASPILDQLARHVETLFFLLIFLCN